MYYAPQQQSVRRHSRLLVCLLVLTIIIIIASFTLILTFFSKDPQSSVIYSTVFVLLLVGSASVYRYTTLSAGGSAVPNQLGAMLVDTHTNDFQLKRLRNVVEEISIASGVQVPAIYVLNTETSINAFASGFTTSDAAITVTRGALIYLNRDELQAVIAHEFSHILNGDMCLNLRMVAIVFGIMIIGITGKKIIIGIFRFRVRGKGVIYVLLTGLIFMAVGFVGWFCGKLIKAAINRQREFLADASAVQFTRQTVGISGALKKIATLENGSLIANPSAEEYSQMFFGQESIHFMHMLDTHPAIMARINIIEPGFTAADLNNYKKQIQLDLTSTSQDKQSPPVTAQTIATTTMLVAAAGAVLSTDAMTAHITTPPKPDHYQQAAIIIDSFPEALQSAARNYYGVMPLVCALLFSSDSQIAAQQAAVIKMNHSDTMLASIQAFYAEVNKLEPIQQLPLLSLCFPALRQHPRADLEKFSKTITDLIKTDQKTTFHEYCLGTMLSLQIREFLNPAQSAKIGNDNLKSASPAVKALFTVLAQEGNCAPAEAKQAFIEGMKIALPDNKMDYQPSPDFAQALENVWAPLDKLSPADKETLVKGLIVTISHNEKITVEEAELFRTICTLIHCPLPLIFQMRVGST